MLRPGEAHSIVEALAWLSSPKYLVRERWVKLTHCRPVQERWSHFGLLKKRLTEAGMWVNGKLTEPSTDKEARKGVDQKKDALTELLRRKAADAETEEKQKLRETEIVAAKKSVKEAEKGVKRTTQFSCEEHILLSASRPLTVTPHVSQMCHWRRPCFWPSRRRPRLIKSKNST